MWSTFARVEPGQRRSCRTRHPRLQGSGGQWFRHCGDGEPCAPVDLSFLLRPQIAQPVIRGASLPRRGSTGTRQHHVLLPVTVSDPLTLSVSSRILLATVTVLMPAALSAQTRIEHFGQFVGLAWDALRRCGRQTPAGSSAGRRLPAWLVELPGADAGGEPVAATYRQRG
jgi:hypothetical protein